MEGYRLQESLARLAVPALIIVGATLAGFIVDRLVVSRVRTAAASRGWKGGEETAHSLAGMNVVLGFLTGVWFALDALNLAERTSRIANTWLMVAAVLAVTLVAARLFAGLTRLYTSRDDSPLPSSTIFVNIVRIAVVTMGALVGLHALGVSITPLLTALGVGGLAVALALQDTLSNLFAGLQLIGSRQINPGEYIQLETGEEGFVEDITWRFTTIRQLSNNLVVIPNAKLASSRIINFGATETEMSVPVGVRVAYDSDLEFVERVTIETAQQVVEGIEGPIEGYEAVVRFHTFGDSSIELTVILRVREYVNQYLVKHEFVKALKARYDAEGIRIPFPQRVVTVRGEIGRAHV